MSTGKKGATRMPQEKESDHPSLIEIEQFAFEHEWVFQLIKFCMNSVSLPYLVSLNVIHQ